jgi:hypothetical protein
VYLGLPVTSVAAVMTGSMAGSARFDLSSLLLLLPR